MKVYLKVKIKSLAAEAQMIRKEERKCNIGCRARVKIRRRLRKSNELTTAERTRMERQLSKPSETAMQAFWGLRLHRTYDVREEARAAHVAYGFLRGRTYAQVEGAALSSPKWDRVEALVKKYGDGDLADRLKKFSEWKDASEPDKASKAA
ncbi:hypothetical protein [Rhizobium leguminosarum]|uniref:hypothetical protein n=1 Tax=Rhizobium leguminosarum TaxID=384 RepID=UPI000481CC3F|nr:hypothetical protein [Rhizobium leguminosarum]